MTQSECSIRLSRRRTACLFLGMLAGMAGKAFADPTTRQTPIVKAIQAAEPAVVNIQGNKTVPSDSSSLASDSGKPQVFSGMGTGIIIDPRGYIVTNLHVVQDVSKIEVTLADGTGCIAQLINYDPATDLALIKVDVNKQLPVISIGSSRDLMRGETVIAIGNPFGYQHTVTVGIVSGLHRDIPVNGGTQDYKDLIQTNADINPGNSGGPLVNIEGDMIGINVAVRIGAQGIGFAIPVDAALDVIANLVAKSQRRPVTTDLQLRNAFDKDQRYLEVAGASRNGESGGDLEAGDCIVAVDGADVRSRLDFELALIGRNPGEQLPLKVRRSGRTIQTQLALSSGSNSKMVAKDSTSEIWDQVGVRVVEVGPSALRANTDGYKGGLKVTEVKPSSPAAQQRIQVGDILVGFAKWKTPTLYELNWVLNKPEVQSNPSAKLYIMRGAVIYHGQLNMQQRSVR